MSVRRTNRRHVYTIPVRHPPKWVETARVRLKSAQGACVLTPAVTSVPTYAARLYMDRLRAGPRPPMLDHSGDGSATVAISDLYQQIPAAMELRFLPEGQVLNFRRDICVATNEED